MATPGYVYILASRRNGRLYVGATSNLVSRVAEHRAGTIPGFTARYRPRRLVHVEAYADIRDAVARERRLKKWRRVWKLALVEGLNPEWADLWPRVASRVVDPGWVLAASDGVDPVPHAHEPSAETAG